MTREPWSVPRLWPGSTIACLGGGPSLSRHQVDRLRGRARVIAVNDAYKLAPWAEVLYACDWRWWLKHGGVPDFAGLKVTLSNSRGHLDAYPDIEIVENTGTEGLERDPRGLRTGRNGGYQAINLAVHLGAKRVLLLGYDMKADARGRTHWFGDHADWPTRAGVFSGVMLPQFAKLAGELEALGVAVVNCTLDSALDVFAKVPLEQALADCLQHPAGPLRR
ncbi:MAG: hypothetical protein IID48_13140 [Proteobacteria bacterium]|nr:hypothetical protein [Pseudomonadota bacterium]